MPELPLDLELSEAKRVLLVVKGAWEFGLSWVLVIGVRHGLLLGKGNLGDSGTEMARGFMGRKSVMVRSEREHRDYAEKKAWVFDAWSRILHHLGD